MTWFLVFVVLLAFLDAAVTVYARRNWRRAKASWAKAVETAEALDAQAKAWSVIYEIQEMNRITMDTWFDEQGLDRFIRVDDRWLPASRCHHCQHVGIRGDDHSCTCPNTDEACLEHPKPVSDKS